MNRIKSADAKYDTLNNITTLITDGDHGSTKYVDEGILYLLSESIKDGFIDISVGTRYISSSLNKELKRSELHPGDVVVTKTGVYFGKSAVIPNEIHVANTSAHVAKITPISSLNPYYLSTFFNSEIGYSQLRRRGIKVSRPEIKLVEFQDILISLPSKIFQKKIEETIKNAQRLLLNSALSFQSSENILLQEIGLQNLEPSKEAVNIKSFKESFGVTGRLDAEYYQTKYEIITNAIKSYKSGFATLESFIENYSTGFPYKSETYSEIEGIPLIRINNISKGNLDLSNAVYIPLKDIELSKKDIANENDILISMSGTIGNSCKIRKGIKALVNQRIMRITPKNYNVDVLPLIINSIIGQSQLERIGTGGVQTNISATDIKEVLIPILDSKTQKQIAELVEESFNLKVESERLLEVAKKTVEMAIEVNEATAIKFIKDNTK